MAKKIKKRRKHKTKTKSEKILLIVFLILSVLVLVLSVVAIKKKSTPNNKSLDYTISILEKNTNNTMNLDISNMELRDLKEMKFKITNYKGKEISEKDLSYEILLKTDQDVDIKLYKEGIKDNLLLNKERKLSELVLKKNKKQEDLYYLIIKCNNQTRDNAKLEIEIRS